MSNDFADTRDSAPTVAPDSTPKSARSLSGTVPRHVGWIEPWIGGSIAIYTALVAVVAYVHWPVLWLYVALAAGLAWWSWRHPARRQRILLLRATTLVALGFVILLQSQVDPLGRENYFFYWINVPLVLYAFLLKPRIAWAFLAMNLSAYLWLVAASSSAASAQVIFLRAGFFFIFSAAAIRMGAVLRRTDELLDRRRVERSSGLLNEFGFLDHGDELWRDARESHSPVTLVFLDIPDLRKIRELYDVDTSRKIAARVVEVFSELDVGKHVLARLTSWRFALLMSGTTREQAFRFVGDRLGRPPKIDMDDDTVDAILLVDVHAVDSKLQGIEFVRFYETELQVLETHAHRKPMTETKPAFVWVEDASPRRADVQIPPTIPVGLNP